MSWTSRSVGCAGSSARRRSSRPFGTSAIGSRPNSVAQLPWFAIAAANVAGMALWPSWETSPLHACCAGFALAHAFRIRGLRPTSLILALLTITTAVLALHDAVAGSDFWEVLDGPLLAGTVVAIVW